MDGSEKITSGLVVAGCDGSELLELTEEILDQMPCLVQVFVIEPLVRAMAFRRDVANGLACGCVCPSCGDRFYLQKSAPHWKSAT